MMGFFKSFFRYRTIWTRIAKYGYFIWLYSHFYNLSFLIITVIQSIYYSFFQGLIRIVEISNRFCLPCWFDNTLLNDVSTQIVKCSFNHGRDWPFNAGDFNHIIRILCYSFWKHHNIHLCIRKEFSRIFTEHHCGNIF